MAPKKSKSAVPFPAMTTFEASAPVPVASASGSGGAGEEDQKANKPPRKRKETRMDAAAAKPEAAVNSKTGDSKSAPVSTVQAGSGGKSTAGSGGSAAAAASQNTKPADTKTSATVAAAGATTVNASAASTNPYRKPVLSQADFDFFNKNGYVVIKQAISDADAAAVVNDVWKFLAPLNPTSKLDQCYDKGSPCNPLGFIEMYHAQSMWNNRQNERVYNAFCDLYKRDDLWVTIDRIGVKLPPSSKYTDYRHTGFTHWDIDPSDPEVTRVCADPNVPPFQLQGVIALEDTSVDMGGLHVYPGMHKYLEKWLSERKVQITQASVDQFYARGFPVKVPKPEWSLKGLEHVVVDMKRGDLAIWRGELAHGNGHNVNPEGRIRYCQYVTYFPQHFDNESARSLRVNSWKSRCHGGQCALPQLAPNGSPPKALMAVAGRGDGREWEQKNLKSAELSELGRKLLGLESW